MAQIEEPSFSLTSQKHELSMLVTSIRDAAIYMLSPAGNVSSWNAGAERFKGYTAGEIMGQHFSRFYTDEDKAAGVPMHALETAVREGKFEAEGWRVRKDGSRFWAQVLIDPLYGDDGRLIGFGKITRDITEKREAAEALMRAKEAALQAKTQEYRHLLRLFEQAPGFVCFFQGPEHIYALQNEVHHRLTGYKDVIGKPVRKAMPELEGQGFFELLDQVFTTGEPYVGRAVPLRVNPASGGLPEQRFIDFVYQPIVGEDNQVLGVFFQGNDITEQVGLKHLVRQKTQELEKTQEALQRSQKLEAIGKLTGGVAHDFNNILQVIAGNLQLLSGYVSNNQLASKRVETALGAVDRGAKLASQLLAFARRQPLQPAVINPSRIIHSMEDLIRRAIGEAIHVETVMGGGLWRTMVDPHQLENVILNLAINARDAMPSGGKLTIEIGNAMLDDTYVASELDIVPGQYVVFAISDTGSGMTKDVLERACDPFFTTKPEGEGTGLGLSMAYGFVKQSGGHFKIYSEVGHGTTIKMYFPRSYDAETEAPLTPSGLAVGGTETILVVEDDITVQTTVVEMLTNLGYRVLKAGDANSALGILKSGLPIDLLFTDVVMPGDLRSPELAKQAKALHPNIEVLFTSGYTQNAIVHGGRLDPGVQLLSKPYRQEQLARKIRHMLTTKQQAPLTQPGIAARTTAARVSIAQFRILVVEDNEDSQQLACELFSILGHEAHSTATAEDALEMLSSGQYDVLFTDIRLPGMPGTELARQAMRINPEIKIIFASGYGSGNDGALDFPHVVLPKPYRLSELEQTLRQATPLPSQQDQLPKR